MKYCSMCGAQIADDATFCSACGAPQEAAASEAKTGAEQQTYNQQGPAPGQQQAQGAYGQPGANAYNQQGYQQGYQQGQPYVDYADLRQDASANKVFGVLAYLGILVLISIFAAPKQSRYARFHSNQGLVLFIFEVGCSIVIGIIAAILLGIGAYNYALLSIFGIISGLLWAAYGILSLVLVILGIVNAANGTVKPLPIIGGITILK